MQTKDQKRQSALERRRRDVEKYTKAMSDGKWEHLFPELDEKKFKSKLTKAQADVATLEERLKHVLVQQTEE